MNRPCQWLIAFSTFSMGCLLHTLMLFLVSREESLLYNIIISLWALLSVRILYHIYSVPPFRTIMVHDFSSLSMMIQAQVPWILAGSVPRLTLPRSTQKKCMQLKLSLGDVLFCFYCVVANEYRNINGQGC